MTKLEYAQKLCKEKYALYNIELPFEKLQWSGELVDVTLNDGTLEVVDRLVEFTLCSLYSYYFIDRYARTLDPKKGPQPFKLFDFQKQALEDFQNHKRIIFRKCLTKDNFVMTDKGYLSIKDVEIGDSILTLNDSGKEVWDKIVNKWDNKEKKSILSVKLNCGSKISGTPDHKIMTLEGWKEIKDVKIGDSIVVNKLEGNIVSEIIKENDALTYDIETKEYHSFLANGILAHNCRQVGASVITGAYALWRANFQKSQIIRVVSLSQSDSLEFKEKTIDIDYEEMPGFLKSKTTRDGNSRTKLKLLNGSQIRVLPKSKNAGRGSTPSLMIIDEAAFNEYMDDIWRAVEPALDHGGDVIVISTTNGVGNWYHLTYTRAEQKLNQFYPIFIPWWRYPGRDNPWLQDILDGKIQDVDEFIKQKELEALSYEGPIDGAPWLFQKRANAKTEKDFQQEIMAEFLGSGDTVITPKTIMEMSLLIKPPVYTDQMPDGHMVRGLWIWKDRIPGHQYMITADSATGHGKDYSALQIVDVDIHEQVGEYKEQIPTDRFGEIIKYIARYYNEAHVVIESNNPGPAVFQEVYRSKEDPYYNVYTVNKGGQPWGWDTTPKSRILLVEDYFKDIENKKTKIFSKRLLEEIKTFSWQENGKPEANKGYNDDLVITWALYAHLWEQSLGNRPIGMLSSKSKRIDPNTAAFAIDWAEKERMYEQIYDCSMHDYYWLQGIQLPKEYIEWLKEKEDENF